MNVITIIIWLLDNNNNSTKFIFIYELTSQPKGQLQTEHEWRKETKHTQTKYKNKAIFIRYNNINIKYTSHCGHYPP
jgi:hypothetical protein